MSAFWDRNTTFNSVSLHVLDNSIRQFYFNSYCEFSGNASGNTVPTVLYIAEGKVQVQIISTTNAQSFGYRLAANNNMQLNASMEFTIPGPGWLYIKPDSVATVVGSGFTLALGPTAPVL
ncbi:hypothetical protein [Hubei sclerotinia RNA virus 1]|uniref:Uncharacterized protein n=1 Tax=Hubei sclerotinia RNA virus 1 TaxID=2605950 RepID=A0A649X026_9VIRU|nr:hypothetical protein [Hubei sclerotinia RNA virus 1]QUE49160.1 MAG: hypothetical protein [Hubei sclerotinia RNA virus 1-WX]